jgi:transcriptional regulator with XRE-family HTH domain
MNKKAGMICKKSRMQARVTITDAADKLGFGTRNIERYESGDYPVSDETLLKMAEIYNDPVLPWNYWTAGSLIAQHHDLKPIENTNFCEAALNAIGEFSEVVKDKDSLISILSDSKVEPQEQSKFITIFGRLSNLYQKVNFLKMIAEKEKTATAIAA